MARDHKLVTSLGGNRLTRRLSRRRDSVISNASFYLAAQRHRVTPTDERDSKSTPGVTLRP
jgi:hypothetical protein